MHRSLAILSGSTAARLAAQLADQMHIPLIAATTCHFPDGEIDVQMGEDVADRDLLIVQSLAKRPNDYLLELCILADTAKRNRARRITAIIPYLSYSRQDHRCSNGKALTAKLIATLLEASGIDQVLLVAPHCETIEGFFSIPVVIVTLGSLLTAALSALKWPRAIVMAADAGRVKSAQHIAHRLGNDLAMVDKKRLNANTLMGDLVGNVHSRDVVIIDDMCATGNTMMHAIEVCRRGGAARIACAICHPIFCGDFYRGFAPHMEMIDHFFVANTIDIQSPLPYFSFHTIDITPHLVNALEKMHPALCKALQI